jgi:4-hydroxy-4-methyl-2-oxoglutarate aldolase
VTSAGRLGTAELTELRGVLRSALVSDALDAVGLRDQTLGPDIARLAGRGLLVGHAYTVAAERVDAVPDVAYVGLRRVLEELGPDDVVVCATDRSDAFAVWGELTSTAAQAAGAVGFVTDGMIRDVREVDQLAFDVLGRGATPRDINGRAELVRHGQPVAIDGVTIGAGDLIVADQDGVVVVPLAVAQIVLERALSKAADEASCHAAVGEGMSVMEALTRFDVL